MPGLRGTGPQGVGPMSGRGRGYCMSYVAQGTDFASRPGRGGGRGRRHRYCATGLPRWARASRDVSPAGAVYAPPVSGEQELDFLKEQVSNLESALEQAKSRIKELEANK